MLSLCYDKCIAKGYNVIETPTLPAELPEDVKDDFGELWEFSIPSGHTLSGYVGVEDRGIWSSI